MTNDMLFGHWYLVSFVPLWFKIRNARLETIKAKDFAKEITNFSTHIKNSREIRKLLGRRKIKPEELPTNEQQLIFDPADESPHRRNGKRKTQPS